MTTLKGRKASPGKAQGRPRIVRTVNDLSAVLEGDILVATQTSIEYTPAMHRAAGLITEAGGRFSHASVWAREHGKPAVIAVEGACDALAGVDEVHLDATAGEIRWSSR